MRIAALSAWLEIVPRSLEWARFCQGCHMVRPEADPDPGACENKCTQRRGY